MIYADDCGRGFAPSHADDPAQVVPCQVRTNAEADAADSGVSVYRLGIDCEWVAEIVQCRVRTELFHVPGDLDMDRDVAQGSGQTTGSGCVSHRLNDAVLERDVEIEPPCRQPSDADRCGHYIRTAQNVAPPGRGFDLPVSL